MAETKGDFLNELKEEFKELGSKVSKLFEDIAGKGEVQGAFSFHVDVCEDASTYSMIADLPGLTKEEVKVQIQENQLVLSGDRKQQAGIGEVKWHKKERGFGAFKRSFAIPPGVTADGIKAKFDNGVLTITLPKVDVEKEKSDISID